MKRELAAGLLLLMLLLGAALNIRHVDALTEELLVSLDRSEHAAERGDFNAALTAYQNALTLWQQSETYAGVFLRHSDTDTASDAFYQLEAALRQEDEQSFPAVYAQLRHRLQVIDRMERLSLGAVF